MWVAAHEQEECVQILAAGGADIDKSGRNSTTAYFVACLSACMSGNKKCMEILQNHGAIFYRSPLIDNNLILPRKLE